MRKLNLQQVPASGAILLLAALLPFASGCGGQEAPTYPASGRVSFESGKPVRFGFVEFRSLETGQCARGQIGFEGDFRLGTFGPDDGAVAGVHQAVVTQYVPAQTIEPTVPTYHEWQEPTDRNPHLLTGVVDPKFADFQTAELEFTVSPTGDNRFEVVVSLAPGTREGSGESPHHGDSDSGDSGSYHH